MKPLAMLLRPAACFNRRLAVHKVLSLRTPSLSQRMASCNEVAVAPWHSVYPPPRDVELMSITREAMLQMMKDSENVATKDFILIDLRRTDYEVRFTFGNLQCRSVPMRSTSYKWQIWNGGVGF